MDMFDWMTGLSRRLRLAALALLVAVGLKTFASILAPVEPPSASVQIEARSFDVTASGTNPHP